MAIRLAILFSLGLLTAGCLRSPAGPTPTAAPTTAPAPTETAAATLTPTRPPGQGLTSGVDAPPMDGCTLQTVLRPADATEVSLFPPVTETDWRLGPDTAATTIVEYGDFQ